MRLANALGRCPAAPRRRFWSRRTRGPRMQSRSPLGMPVLAAAPGSVGRAVSGRSPGHSHPGSPSHVATTHVKPCTRESCTLRGTCRSTCRSRHISLTPERRPLPERSPPVVTGAPPTLNDQSACRSCRPARNGPEEATCPSRARRQQTSRSEEHTSELQSPYDIGCHLLLEKKKKK